LETQQTEYKKTFGKETIISLAAFANTDGGRVIVGIEDDGSVCGVQVGSETVQRYLNEIKTATYPQLYPKVRLEQHDENTIIIFEINEYPIKPVAYKNRYYKRVHNSNHLLSLEEIVDLQQQSLSVSFDAYPANVSLEQLDRELITRFFELVQKETPRLCRGTLKV
jgi:ATP-dependent DNA helicase RecG